MRVWIYLKSWEFYGKIVVIPRELYEKIREIILYGIHEILETENPRVLCSMLFTVTFTSGFLPAERRKTTNELKVPKRENFSLAFFAQSEPIWVCDLGTGEKNRIFFQLTPDFDGFGFLPHTECAVNKKKT